MKLSVPEFEIESSEMTPEEIEARAQRRSATIDLYWRHIHAELLNELHEFESITSGSKDV